MSVPVEPSIVSESASPAATILNKSSPLPPLNTSIPAPPIKLYPPAEDKLMSIVLPEESDVSLAVPKLLEPAFAI